VDGVDSFILSAFDEFVGDPEVELWVNDSGRPFTDAAAKIGFAEGKLSDVAIVNIRTTDGRVLHWGVAFLANRQGSDDFDPRSNQSGKALKTIVQQWLRP
jgi:hypothetical protein